MTKSKKELVQALMTHTNLNQDDVTTASGSAGLYKSGIKKLLDRLKDDDGPEKTYKEHIKDNYSPKNY